jgi:hypothetical protein
MIPPGGWHYYQSDVRLESWSLDNLYKVVENYRAENSLPVGDVEGDVNAQICGRSPHFCHGVDSVSINFTSTRAVDATTELLNDIQTWAKNLLQSNTPYSFVTEEEAERRAQICLKCPNNANWRGGCSSCINTTDRVCASVRQAKETKTSPILGGCHVLRHDNRTAVFLDKEVIALAEDLPEGCWAK